MLWYKAWLETRWRMMLIVGPMLFIIFKSASWGATQQRGHRDSPAVLERPPPR